MVKNQSIKQNDTKRSKIPQCSSTQESEFTSSTQRQTDLSNVMIVTTQIWRWSEAELKTKTWVLFPLQLERTCTGCSWETSVKLLSLTLSCLISDAGVLFFMARPPQQHLNLTGGSQPYCHLHGNTTLELLLYSIYNTNWQRWEYSVTKLFLREWCTWWMMK